MLAKRWMRLGLALLLVAHLAGCSSVVARVNGKNVTRQEFHDELEQTHGMPMLQTMILRRLILDRAEAEGVLPTAEELQQEFDKWRTDQFGGDETAMRQAMKAQGLDDTTVLGQIKLDMVIFRLRTHHLSPTEEELRRFFGEFRERYFDKPERVTFRQIVLPSKEAAEQLLAQLNTEETIFSEVARTVSIDQRTREEGGLVSEVPWEVLKAQAPTLYGGLRKLEPNGISQEPIDVQNAFVVVKLIETLPADPANFDDPETHEEVRRAYLAQNAKSEQEFMAEVTQNADVMVLDSRYKAAIEPRFAAGGGLPSEVQDQLSQPPEIAPPTFVEEGAEPPVTSGTEPLGGGGN